MAVRSGDGKRKDPTYSSINQKLDYRLLCKVLEGITGFGCGRPFS
jgi:hypothetical protein